MSDNSAQLVVNIFGKEDCDKCTMLNRRIDKLLKEDTYAAFVKKYHDVLSEDGLLRFCVAQCLNPSRIPAMIISRIDSNGKEEFILNPDAGKVDKICKDSKLHQLLGLQTDYSDVGKGLLTPKMLKAILDKALELGN